ncbi:MAG: hypothetical protein ABL930_03860 [Pseudobdellovibrio sp.]
MSELKVSRNKLIVLATNKDNVPFQYKVDINDVEMTAVDKCVVLELHSELRSILRAQANLDECLKTLRDLLSNGAQGAPSSFYLNTAKRSQFAYATILYGACFLNGENRSRPLRTVSSSILNDQNHNEIMTYRNKLFGHIDENHEVRKDNLFWAFTVCDDILKPIAANLEGVFTSMPSIGSIQSWIEHIIKLNEIIFTRSNELRESIKSKIQVVKIVE